MLGLSGSPTGSGVDGPMLSVLAFAVAGYSR